MWNLMLIYNIFIAIFIIAAIIGLYQLLQVWQLLFGIVYKLLNLTIFLPFLLRDSIHKLLNLAPYFLPVEVFVHEYWNKLNIFW